MYRTPHHHKQTGQSLLQQLLMLACLIASLGAGTLQAQDRWYQVELSVFTHEAFDPERQIPGQERWLDRPEDVSYPRNLAKLNTLAEALSLEDWSVLQPVPAGSAEPNDDDGQGKPETPLPRPFAASPDFRLPDFQRDPFVRLPASAHDFTQTNAAFTRSPQHRLLYHAAWRQVIRQPGLSQHIAVSGGQAFGDRHELEGSVRFRFNPNEDRVVIDADLWLTRFSLDPDREAISLPPLPNLLASPEVVSDVAGAHPVQLFRLEQSRDMRSNEFHYLDHPALGVVVMVRPYELPAPAESTAAESTARP